MQSDGFHGRATIPPVAAQTADAGTRRIGIKVHAHQAVKRIHQRDRIGATGPGGGRHVGNVSHVGRKLNDHRRAGHFFNPAGNHGRVFGHLANGRTHAAFAHAMRTAKIQLQQVRA